MKVKVLGISGSPRHGNTDTLVREALRAAKALGVQTTFLSLADLRVEPCQGCYQCYGFYRGATWERICYLHNDDVSSIYRQIQGADGIIIGSPVYAFDITAKLKALMERGAPFCHYAASELSGAIRYKVVGGIVVAFERRGGQESALGSIWRWAVGVCSGLVVGAPPFPPDHPPQGSFLGGLADTCDSRHPLGEKGVTRHGSRVKPPTSGIYNMRAARNLGRSVAQTALTMKRGMEALRKEGYLFPPLPLVAYPEEEIREGSYLDRIRRGESNPPAYQMVKF
ncbi:MAG: flavodoxin family protein [Deltaproteobacteria bacterium]|nr:MAG: flavodoxin family protein [Deltaproteobacteria bacterium]